MTIFAQRWWWLLLLGPLLAGSTAYSVSSRQQPMYAASAMLLINQSQNTNALDYTAVLAGKSLTDTYQQLIRTWPVLMPVIADLGLPYGVAELQNKVSVSTVLDTRIIVVKVSDSNSQRATDIANAIAQRFAEYVSGLAAQVNSPARALISQQITDTKSQIDELGRQNQTLEIRSNLNQLQQTYNQLLLTAQTMDLNAAAAKSQVTVAVPAVLASKPYAPRVLLATLLGTLPSLLIISGAIGVLEYLRAPTKINPDSHRRDFLSQRPPHRPLRGNQTNTIHSQSSTPARRSADKRQ